MDKINILNQIFELVVYPVLSLTGIYVTYLISAKIKEIKQKTTDDTAKKYLTMLDDTIATAVVATTQTYVDSLKKQGKFDIEAQKTAFSQTYDAIMAVLTEESVKYITLLVGDLELYITNKIEADVALYK